MRKVWIIVANSSQSKIYRAENVNTLIEHKAFEHNEAHLPAKDLSSDRQGRATKRSGYGTDTLEEPTSSKLKEANQFAHQLVQFLDEGLKENLFERLYVIAKPPFLGILRQSLNAHLTKLVEKEVHKDLTQSKPAEIREYLPPVL